MPRRGAIGPRRSARRDRATAARSGHWGAIGPLGRDQPQCGGRSASSQSSLPPGRSPQPRSVSSLVCSGSTTKSSLRSTTRSSSSRGARMAGSVTSSNDTAGRAAGSIPGTGRIDPSPAVPVRKPPDRHPPGARGRGGGDRRVGRPTGRGVGSVGRRDDAERWQPRRRDLATPGATGHSRGERPRGGPPGRCGQRGRPPGRSRPTAGGRP